MEVAEERKVGIPKIPVDKKVWTEGAEQPGNGSGLAIGSSLKADQRG